MSRYDGEYIHGDLQLSNFNEKPIQIYKFKVNCHYKLRSFFFTARKEKKNQRSEILMISNEMVPLNIQYLRIDKKKD
jgi:hypothetical protein